MLPSFFLTNNTGAPQGETLGLTNFLSSKSLSYPHFGPKNTRSNFLSVFHYFKSTMSMLQFYTMLQTHIVLFLSLIFLHLKPSKVFFFLCKSLKGVSKTMAYFPAFYSKFCIKSYKGAFWSFPTKEPILVPTICP